MQRGPPPLPLPPGFQEELDMRRQRIDGLQPPPADAADAGDVDAPRARAADTAAAAAAAEPRLPQSTKPAGAKARRGPDAADDIAVHAVAAPDAAAPLFEGSDAPSDDGAAARAALGGQSTTWEMGSFVGRQRSIYDSWTMPKRYTLLGLMSFATFLVPFSDTVYLPAMAVIEKDLKTTSTLMASTIAVYMFVVGLSALVWGPFADRYGRRRTLLIASSIFTAVSVACIFSVNIAMLIALRALQGGAVSAMMVSSNAVLADSWEPAQRGKAMGIFMIPTLVGPIAGPLLGGALSQGLGWRSTFAAMAICGGAIFLALLFFMEERIRTAEGDLAASSIQEASHIPEPVFRAPWKPLRYLIEPAIFPHAAVTFLLYASMFSALIVLPNVLAHAPYNLSEAMIGVANVPLGVGCFIVGPFGGRWADAGARRWNSSPAGRMVPGLMSAVLVFPLSMVVYAWTLGLHMHLALPLTASFFMGASICTFFPGVMSYVSILKQHAAAAAGGAVQAMMFICGGVFIQITPPAMAALGLGTWLTLLTGVVLFTSAISALLTWGALRRGSMEQLPVSGGGGAPAPATAAKLADADGAPVLKA
ncbi:MFS general substrate transporter [Raphidocelis subcapitata]|uniref:MFS general substrate transporter n=1 Tax=Raphidocelis subcapitata TaxID=307507 RepID=A0A2V0PAC8_9CHLO|nr:MFS general substrate transporter [Raphidocelis subcapitata]|eukprot:GBF94820.1 MFS general substrate transporter [Raphidocelis subcapitata]